MDHISRTIRSEILLFPGGLALHRNNGPSALQGITLSAGQQMLSSVSLLPSQSVELPVKGLKGALAHMAPFLQG